MRELTARARGKNKQEWAQTSAVIATLANCHRDPKRRRTPFSPDEFNPFADRAQGKPRGIAINRHTIRAIGQAFVGRRA